MVLINIKIFNKFENLVILLSEQKFGDFGGGDYISIWFKSLSWRYRNWMSFPRHIYLYLNLKTVRIIKNIENLLIKIKNQSIKIINSSKDFNTLKV